MSKCMRTTVRLDDELLAKAKRYASESGRTLTAVIEDGLRQILAPARPSRTHGVRLPVFHGKGLRPGVDLSDNAALRDLMDNV